MYESISGGSEIPSSGVDMNDDFACVWCVRWEHGEKGIGDGCYKRGAGRARIHEEDLPLALPSLHLVVCGGEPKSPS